MEPLQCTRNEITPIKSISSADTTIPGPLMAGESKSTLAEADEAEIAGRKYVTAERLASILEVLGAMERIPHWPAEDFNRQDSSI